MDTRVPRIAHLHKSAVKYEAHAKHPQNRCGVCEHFVKGGECTLVLGPIAASGWCVLFEPELIPCDLK